MSAQAEWTKKSRVIAHKKGKNITPMWCPLWSAKAGANCTDCQFNLGSAVSKGAKGGRMTIVCAHPPGKGAGGSP